MPTSSCEADTLEAAAATDSCTNCPVIAAVVFVMLALVGSAMTLPPDQTRSPREPALERSRGKTMMRSTAEGRYEEELAVATGASIATACGYPRVNCARVMLGGVGVVYDFKAVIFFGSHLCTHHAELCLLQLRRECRCLGRSARSSSHGIACMGARTKRGEEPVAVHLSSLYHTRCGDATTTTTNRYLSLWHPLRIFNILNSSGSVCLLSELNTIK
jgi:hypothetical protein